MGVRLADFIRGHHEQILTEWEAFAGTLQPAADGLSRAGLRDHAEEILTAIVLDMESCQSAAEETEKSKGLKPAGYLGELGRIHALLRIDSGFSLSQVVAEYRALRASVLRLCATAGDDPTGALRFNEAIDEALAEAVDRYAQRTDQYRDQLIGLVSHDLRNPLGGILMGSTVLSRAEGIDDRNARVVARIHGSAQRMTRIVDDLLDLTRARFGSQIPLVRRPLDFGTLCETTIAELEASRPDARIEYTSTGELRGEWDGDRLAQVVSNLVDNALKHGDARKAVRVVAKGEIEAVVLQVHNEGPAIPANALRDIFEPTVRVAQTPGKASAGLGLGLSIARALVVAHGGEIEVKSSEVDGTTFTVHLPRAGG
jgi:signal transduction histidine kinase